ncbi:MAG: ATP-dependent zinc metalloprotease FtsH [Acidimicrobiia bacterium]|nr:ATP-dependent zinc metalloprotease FtsH [Acidimicrobiia bacterium]
MNRPEPTPKTPRIGWLVWLTTGVVLVAVFATIDAPRDVDHDYGYSEFLAQIDAGTIATADIESDGATSGELTDGSSYETRIPVELSGEELLARLEDAGVEIESSPTEESLTSTILGWMLALLPIAILIGFFVWIARRSGGVASSLSMGRSKASVFDADHPTTTFADVAGYEAVKGEIREIVDFLSDPERYQVAGAIAPRGVLMTGPPGTGKTLMARALAGEVGVPFLSVTGSSFVEMFVGVGASRVRDLFAEAKKLAPAIIFVDEIDAIGQRRHSGSMLANDEREQTLNQLLAEMDGFDTRAGIIVLAATNRAELLDAALLRPGRFDRQVTIPLPNQTERDAILRVHCRGKRIADDDHLSTVARQTPGFSGADLANLVNEAAIRAARDQRSTISDDDFDAAYDRILLGQRDRSHVLLPEERKAVAAHEAGHAIVAALSTAADPVHKVTILPAGDSLGSTQQLPEHDRHLYSEQYLYDTLAVQVGGRAAEQLLFGSASTGAANDLAVATAMATKMVKEYGLSPRLGPISYPTGGAMHLPDDQPHLGRPYAEATQRVVDEEVSRILNDALDRATRTLEDARRELEALTELLLHDETVDGPTVYGLVKRRTPSPRPQVLQDESHREARTTGADPSTTGADPSTTGADPSTTGADPSTTGADARAVRG